MRQVTSQVIFVANGATDIFEEIVTMLRWEHQQWTTTAPFSLWKPRTCLASQAKHILYGGQHQTKFFHWLMVLIVETLGNRLPGDYIGLVFLENKSAESGLERLVWSFSYRCLNMLRAETCVFIHRNQALHSTALFYMSIMYSQP